MHIGLSHIAILTIITSMVACKVQELNVYEIEDFHVEEYVGTKQNLKSDIQFISIAYSDLFGKEIPSDELNYYMESYDSIGDKTLIIDIIVRAFLNNEQVEIPTDSFMRSDPETFIRNTYKKFLVRQPSDAEVWYFKNIISNHQELKPITVYYAVIISDEYRYY